MKNYKLAPMYDKNLASYEIENTGNIAWVTISRSDDDNSLHDKLTSFGLLEKTTKRGWTIVCHRLCQKPVIIFLSRTHYHKTEM